MGRRQVTTKHFAHAGETVVDPYHYTECGLDDIYLRSGYQRETTPYGDGVSVRHVDELHDAIGQFLVTARKELSGKEIRFLRKQMDLTQAELGLLIGVSDQQVARCEKEQSEMARSSDYLLRTIYLQHLKRETRVVELVEALRGLDAIRSGNAQFFLDAKKGWKPQLAA